MGNHAILADAMPASQHQHPLFNLVTSQATHVSVKSLHLLDDLLQRSLLENLIALKSRLRVSILLFQSIKLGSHLVFQLLSFFSVFGVDLI
jgi:hypothetical protein